MGEAEDLNDARNRTAKRRAQQVRVFGDRDVLPDVEPKLRAALLAAHDIFAFNVVADIAVHNSLWICCVCLKSAHVTTLITGGTVVTPLCAACRTAIYGFYPYGKPTRA